MGTWHPLLLHILGMGAGEASLVTDVFGWDQPVVAAVGRRQHAASDSFFAPDGASVPQTWKTQAAAGRPTGGQSVTGRPPNP